MDHARIYPDGRCNQPGSQAAPRPAVQCALVTRPAKSRDFSRVFARIRWQSPRFVRVHPELASMDSGRRGKAKLLKYDNLLQFQVATPAGIEPATFSLEGLDAISGVLRP
jgi:hypothetical protein